MRKFAETGLVTLDLVNTWDEYLPDPERLPDDAALARFIAEVSGAGTPVPVGPGDLASVCTLRGQLRELLTGAPTDRTDALASWMDGLDLRVTVTPVAGAPQLRLTARDGASLAERMAVQAVTELLGLAADGHWDRLRRCAAHPCRDAFVDHSRPGRRAYCSTRCANRVHAAASRARHRTAAALQ